LPQIREVIDTFDLVEQVLERDVSAVLTRKERGRGVISTRTIPLTYFCPPREPIGALSLPTTRAAPDIGDKS